jgi:hypothetical protein
MKRITRRQFGKLGFGFGAAIGAEYLALQKEARGNSFGVPFTIALVPDPQRLAGGWPCSGATAYNQLIQWAITNRNLSVVGVPLNIKGFLQVGDCADVVSSSVYDSQQQVSVNAYALAEAASPKMFVARCIGNHDYQGAGTGRGNDVGFMWRNDTNGAWSPTNVANIYGGGLDIGHGDVAMYGGVYPDPTFPISNANNYMLLRIQGMRIGILALEFYPRSSVLVWAKSIHDAHPDYQWWVTTHGYMDTSGARCAPISTWGPATYGLADAPLSNSGTEMWGGSDVTWLGLTKWDNLTGVFCGHWIDGYGSGWVWQKLASVASGTKGQTVQQVFCDCQEADLTNFCSGNPTTPDGTSDTMHLMLLRVTPATQMMEAFLVSTNSGKWTGTTGVRNNATPIQLFNVSMAGPTNGLFPMPIPMIG